MEHGINGNKKVVVNKDWTIKICVIFVVLNEDEGIDMNNKNKINVCRVD